MSKTIARALDAAHPSPPALKPCPFCGTAPIVRDQLAEQNDQYFVWCDECLAEGPPEHIEEAAIASWNTRK